MRHWVLAGRPSGRPDPEADFAFETVDRPEPGPGELLVEVRYLSVDPYMRGRMQAGESYAQPWAVGEPLHGGVVGDVVESCAPDFEAGDVVVGRGDWAEYATIDAGDARPVDPEQAPVSTALGVLGMPGRTAYFGAREVLEPKPGDTVVVSAAAGAVGSVVGQLVDMAGARVVGVASTAEKLAFLDEAGFAAGINRVEEAVPAALDRTCPDGVDAYFDNTGGPITDAVFDWLNVDSRVAVCGQIALYNAEEQPVGPRKLGRLISTRARVEGLLHSDFAPRHDAAVEDLAEWVNGGELVYREHVVEGLESAPEAFLALFDGAKVGKQLVRPR